MPATDGLGYYTLQRHTNGPRVRTKQAWLHKVVSRRASSLAWKAPAPAARALQVDQDGL
jgi:hypothetical protein